MADKELVWLHGEVKTPPFSAEARRLLGFFLRLIQKGVRLSMPDSRPMSIIGPCCNELRVRDAERGVVWRLIYRIDDDAVVIGDVFVKKSQRTPRRVIAACRRRFRLYDESSR